MSTTKLHSVVASVVVATGLASGLAYATAQPEKAEKPTFQAPEAAAWTGIEMAVPAVMAAEMATRVSRPAPNTNTAVDAQADAADKAEKAVKALTEGGAAMMNFGAVWHVFSDEESLRQAFGSDIKAPAPIGIAAIDSGKRPAGLTNTRANDAVVVKSAADLIREASRAHEERAQAEPVYKVAPAVPENPAEEVPTVWEIELMDPTKAGMFVQPLDVASSPAAEEYKQDPADTMADDIMDMGEAAAMEPVAPPAEPVRVVEVEGQSPERTAWMTTDDLPQMAKDKALTELKLAAEIAGVKHGKEDGVIVDALNNAEQAGADVAYDVDAMPFPAEIIDRVGVVEAEEIPIKVEPAAFAPFELGLPKRAADARSVRTLVETFAGHDGPITLRVEERIDGVKVRVETAASDKPLIEVFHHQEISPDMLDFILDEIGMRMAGDADVGMIKSLNSHYAVMKAIDDGAPAAGDLPQ